MAPKLGELPGGLPPKIAPGEAAWVGAGELGPDLVEDVLGSSNCRASSASRCATKARGVAVPVGLVLAILGELVRLRSASAPSNRHARSGTGAAGCASSASLPMRRFHPTIRTT